MEKICLMNKYPLYIYLFIHVYSWYLHSGPQIAQMQQFILRRLQTFLGFCVEFGRGLDLEHIYEIGSDLEPGGVPCYHIQHMSKSQNFVR